VAQKEQGLEEVNQPKTISKEEIVTSIENLIADYKVHSEGLAKEIKSLSKKSLIRILKDSIKYPMEENEDFASEEEVSIASKIRAIQDIKGRLTVNYLMVEGHELKEKENGQQG
jgi:hypothetical protein